MAQQNLTNSVPKYQRRCRRNDKFHQRFQFGLQRACLNPRRDSPEVLALEAGLLVIFARKCLHDANRREYLLCDRGNFSLTPPDIARGLFHAPCKPVHQDEQYGSDAQSDQGESPIHRNYDEDHAAESNTVDQESQQSRLDQFSGHIDVTSQGAHQVPQPLLVVVGEREALNVPIKVATHVVHDPVADARHQIVLNE